MLLADMARPSMPLKLAEATSACKAVHCRCGWARSLAITRPSSAPAKPRPTAASVPPFMPTKPLAFFRPSVSWRTAVSTLAPCTRTALSLCEKAIAPSKRAKPNRSTCSWPEARSSWPSEPARSRLSVLPVPVATARALSPAKSSTTPLASPWLIATDKALPDRARPSMPTKPTLPACALSALHWRGPVATRSLARARPKAASSSRKPVAWSLPAFRPAKAEMPVPPTVSRSTATSPASSAAVPAWSAVCSVARLRSIAKEPVAWKKSSMPSSSVPLARSSGPRLPAMSSVTLWPVATGTARLCAW